MSETGIFDAAGDGYWSNLTQDENKSLMDALRVGPARGALLKHQPWLEDVIYSPKRQAGLELLQLRGDEVCIDYGCMWGALTVPLALRTKFVLGIDQTLESLQFLQARLKEEGIDNVALLRNDLRKMPSFPESARVDVAVVNGVLEWIPEVGRIDLKTYYGKRQAKDYSGHPGEQQESFLRQVHRNLNENGKLYFAIENRFDFKMFLGAKDPHSNTLLTSVVPRKMADWISRVKLGRPYVNWIYSFGGVSALLKRAGFSKVDLFMCFPDYRFPESIIPYGRSLNDFRLTISRKNSQGKTTFKRALARAAEFVVFKMLRAKALAPSIVALGHK
jgi:SAM-dependent methyltransferase